MAVCMPADGIVPFLLVLVTTVFGTESPDILKLSLEPEVRRHFAMGTAALVTTV